MTPRPRINVGDMRDVVDIYTDASDGTDEQQSFTGLPTYKDVPAMVDHVGGSEKEQTTFVQYEVTCHYLDDVTESQQVSITQGTFSGETLNITEVETVRVHGRPRWLVLHAIKVS